MANLPESPTWDPGVFQLEIDTPVQGGPSGASNTPLKNLANRTVYLKQQVDAQATAQAANAPLDSPHFTGDAQGPDVTLGNRGGKLANTKFVADTVGGVLSKDISGSGNFTLSAAEAGNAILLLTGTLTGAANLIVPASPTRDWLVVNRTTGAFAVTVKTLGGTGVTVSQGKQATCFTLSGNIAKNETDFADIVLSGAPLAPLAAQNANDQSIATTQWVNRNGLRFSGVTTSRAPGTFTAADVGGIFFPTGAGNYTLPLASSVPTGATITMAFDDSTAVNVFRQGTDLLRQGGALYSSVAPKSGLVTFTAMAGVWVMSGEGTIPLSVQFQASKGATGFQKLPSGMILQYGVTSVIGAGQGQFIAFPVSYPSRVGAINVTYQSDAIQPAAGNPTQVHTVQLSQFAIRNGGTVDAVYYWQSIGY